MSLLLLSYCPVQYRKDLDLNDGFDPNNHFHIANDPERSLRYEEAKIAREQGVSTDKWIEIKITRSVGSALDELLCYLDLIKSKKSRIATCRDVIDSANEIIRCAKNELVEMGVRK